VFTASNELLQASQNECTDEGVGNF
jgi:hypothetical protein